MAEIERFDHRHSKYLPEGVREGGREGVREGGVVAYLEQLQTVGVITRRGWS